MLSRPVELLRHLELLNCFRREVKNRPERDPWRRDCRFFSGEAHLYCAVRPLGPCDGCGDFEPEKLGENHD